MTTLVLGSMVLYRCVRCCWEIWADLLEPFTGRHGP